MDVRQRQYEIARKGTETSTLTTGYLSSCFAVYGWHKDRKIGFLWHLDAHARGLGLIAEPLRHDPDDEGVDVGLDGFEVYMTSGYGLYLRLMAALVVAAIAIFAGSTTDSWISWIVGGACYGWLLGYWLFNWIAIRIEVRKVFGKPCGFRHASFCARVAYIHGFVRAVRANMLNVLCIFQWPRTAVTIDAERGTQPPILEVWTVFGTTEDRFGPTGKSKCSDLPERVTKSRERGADREGSRYYWLWQIGGIAGVVLSGLLIIGGRWLVWRHLHAGPAGLMCEVVWTVFWLGWGGACLLGVVRRGFQAKLVETDREPCQGRP